MQAVSRILIPTLLLLTVTTPLTAAPPSADSHTWCGTTDPTATLIEIAQHEAFQRSLERKRSTRPLALKLAPTIEQVGQVAIIRDDGTLIRPPNLFDLQGESMQFLRRPRGIGAVRSALTFKQLIGDRIEIGDDASVRINFPADFRFPFGDRVYASVFLNSDGNLTFGAPDSGNSARSLNRFLNGPPRIAPLFTDLDPSVTEGGDGVYVAFLNSRVRITFVGVPEFGTSNSNTFQITLFTTGRVNFAYGDDMQAGSAIVGVAPFESVELNVVDYDEELPLRPRRQAMAEQYDTSQVVDEPAIVTTFLNQYRDLYDWVSIWLDFPGQLGGNAFAFTSATKNEVTGIGVPLFDFNSAFGSAGRLEAYIQMGHVRKYDAAPDAIVNRSYTSLATLAHEAGHNWLSFVSYREPNGAVTGRLIGAGNSHWSQHMDADGSFMEGYDYEDQGGGVFLITDRTTTHFSPLDQYLMGFIPASQVPDFFYLENPGNFNQNDVTDASRINTTISGSRVDASVDNVVNVEGVRRPGPAASRKDFRMAFVLVVRQGDEPDPELVDRLNTIRGQFPGYWRQVTDNRSTMRTALFPK